MNTCDIPDRQNSGLSLKRIAAWSHLYGHAKLVAGWQLILSVPLALVMSLIALRWPDAKVVTTPLSLLFGWLDLLWLERIQGDRKKIAAKVQEEFDCDLFHLEWNDLRCSSHPESEQVNEAARSYLKDQPSPEAHKDWYPVEVGKLPLPLTRLICQRSAVWWDMSQRRKYVGWLLGVVVVLVLGVVAASFATDQKVRDMVLSVYLPLAPAVVWGVKEFIRQKDTVASLEKTKGHIEKIFNDAISGKRSLAELSAASRNIQDMIFDGRSRNVLLFNFVYNRLRSSQERLMQDKASEMIAEALSKQSLWR